MNKKNIIGTFIHEAFNKGNNSIINELVHPDYRYSSPSDYLEGPSELSRFISALRRAFPDLLVEVIDQVEDSNKVCTRLTVRGTHLGRYLDVPPTGNRINVEGIVISRFQDGLIHGEWELLDHYTFLAQLGVIKNVN